MANYENVLVESNDGVTRVTLNRPRVLNALNRATLGELAQSLDLASRSARVLVITGAGDKAFVAGADIQEMMVLGAWEAAQFSKLGHEVLSRLEGCDAITIAEVNGFALGGGCELMLACDFAIASDNARFGQPEVGLGVTPGFGGTVRLARRIGGARARQLLFTGESIKAPEALAMGLVNEVVPRAELRSRVDSLAHRIARNAPRALALTKRAARIAEESDLATACAFEQQAFGLCFATEDQREGMRAFAEKREAKWMGR